MSSPTCFSINRRNFTTRSPEGLERLEKLLPEVYKELHIAGTRLERHFKDMQDFEFTIQQGNLFILQSRNGKRTPWAALVIAVDLVNDNLIDTKTAFRRLDSYDLEKVERRIIVSSRSGAKNIKDIQTTKNVQVLANGVPASPGIAIGKIVLDSKKAKEIAMTGKPTILIRTEISTDDISGMDVSEGILTRVGGKTSHAALVSRQMNKVCIVGCQRLSIDMKSRKCTIGKEVLYEGVYISLDGNTGSIYQGKIEFQIEKPEQLLSEVKQWNQPQRKTL